MSMTPAAEMPAESTAGDRASVVVRMALRAFGDGQRAADWLTQPSDLFDGQAPLDFAKASVAGCARVCQVLDRVTHPD